MYQLQLDRKIGKCFNGKILGVVLNYEFCERDYALPSPFYARILSKRKMANPRELGTRVSGWPRRSTSSTPGYPTGSNSYGVEKTVRL